MTAVVKVLFSVGLSILRVLFGGFVLSKLWTWLIMPKFEYAPALNRLDAIGVMFVIQFIAGSIWLGLRRTTEEEERQTAAAMLNPSVRHAQWKKGIIGQVIILLVYYPLCLVLAYLWKHFI